MSIHRRSTSDTAFWFDSRRTLLISHVHVFVAQAAYVIPLVTNEYAGYTRDCFLAAHITERIIVIAWRAHKSILDPMAWSDHATCEALADFVGFPID